MKDFLGKKKKERGEKKKEVFKKSPENLPFL